MSVTSPWSLYLLECRNGSYYAGITNNVAARLAAHACGKGARYTRANPPARLLATRAYPDRASASRAEWALKQLPRARKLTFLTPTDPDSAHLPLMIRGDALDDARVIALLQLHRYDMTLHSPAGSIHALDVDALHAPAITFWAAWRGEDLLGCAALQALDDTHGEIKSMRTAAIAQGQGAASALLTHLIAEARARGWRRLSLETGSAAAFAPAHRLYARAGFVGCAPFGGYVEDPYSVYMTRTLDDAVAPHPVPA